MSSKTSLATPTKRLSLITPAVGYPLFLLILPVILCLVNSSWLFIDQINDHLKAEIGTIDPWVYLGFQINLKAHLSSFQGTYYATRLPWILPGYLAYHFFSPIVAKYIFHFVFYYAACFSVFSILKKTVGLRAAFFVTILMETWIGVLLHYGSHYISSGVMTYLLLTMFMLTPTSDKKSSLLHLFFAGFFCSCFIFTQLFMSVVLPLIALYYVFMNRPKTRASFSKDLRMFVFGFIVATALFCSISYVLSGKFLFFEPCFLWTVKFVTSTNPWRIPISLWIWKNMPVLSMSGAVFLVALVTLIFRKRLSQEPNHKMHLFFSFHFLAIAFVFIFFELIMKQPVLQLDFYHCFMLPALLLALGGFIAPTLNRMDSKQYYGLIGLTLIGCLCGYMKNLPTFDGDFLTYFLCILIIASAGMILIQVRKQTVSILGALTLIAAFSLSNACDSFHKKYDNPLLKQYYSSIFKVFETTKNLDPTDRLLFWYNKNNLDYYRSIFKPVASLYLWGFRIVNESFPSINDFSNNPHKNLGGKNILIFSIPGETPIDDAQKSLASLGLKGEILDQTSFENGEIKFNLHYIHVRDDE